MPENTNSYSSKLSIMAQNMFGSFSRWWNVKWKNQEQSEYWCK